MFTERQTLRVMEEEHALNMEVTQAQHDNSLVQAEHGATLEPATEKVTTTTGGGKKSVSKVVTKPSKQAKAAGNSVKTMSAPTNQHGTKTGPQKSKLDQLLKNEQITLDFFEKRYGKDSSIYKTNVEACKQRIVKRLKLTETDKEVRDSVDLLNKYFNIV
jgi:hypothetical protein